MQGLLDSKRIKGGRVGDYIGDNYRDFKGILGIQGGAQDPGRLGTSCYTCVSVPGQSAMLAATMFEPHGCHTMVRGKHFFSQCLQQCRGESPSAAHFEFGHMSPQMATGNVDCSWAWQFYFHPPCRPLIAQNSGSFSWAGSSKLGIK